MLGCRRQSDSSMRLGRWSTDGHPDVSQHAASLASKRHVYFVLYQHATCVALFDFTGDQESFL